MVIALCALNVQLLLAQMVSNDLIMKVISWTMIKSSAARNVWLINVIESVEFAKRSLKMRKFLLWNNTSTQTVSNVLNVKSQLETR